MIEFGKTLRLAREAKGYTTAQLAELTKMAPSTIVELESENFSRIAAPIYGRGFVKLYCEAVGIDPKPLIDEFMAIFSGERSVGIRDRNVCEPAAAEPPPPPPPPPSQTPKEPTQEEPTLFTEEKADTPASDETVPPPKRDPFSSPAEPEAPHRQAQRTLSRYAAPVRTIHMPSVPPAVWRIGILGTLALLLLWGLTVGVRALYRATTTEKGVKTEESAKPAATKPVAAKPVAAKPAAAKPAAAKPTKATRRTVQKIPSLYAD